MRNKVVQLSLSDTYTDVLDKMEENKSELVELLEEYIDFEAIISPQFQDAYNKHYVRKRINLLESFIRAFILQRLLGMKQNKQLLTLLKFSKELREFCGFEKLPDEPQLTRFKQQFTDYIEMMFYSLVDITEPICREINEKKSQYLIYDTTGIEPKVKENNPKFLNTKLRDAKKLAKSNPEIDPYKLVYSLLPDEAAKAPMARQQYINGHYCYAYKAGIITDGLGIVRHISFFDQDFRTKHPEVITAKSDNPDKDKEIGDSVSLKPVLSDFFNVHKSFSYSTFLGDSAFDSYDIYSMLKNDFNFSRACIPLNSRNTKSSNSNFTNMEIRYVLWTVPNLSVWANPGAKIVLQESNGFVINPLKKATQGLLPVKLPVRNPLTENVLTPIRRRISEAVPAFPATLNIGIIFTNTGFLLKER